MKRVIVWAVVGALVGVALGQAHGRPGVGASVGALGAALVGHVAGGDTAPRKALGAEPTASALLLQEARFRSKWTEGAPVKTGADALLAVLTAFGKARWETPTQYSYWKDMSEAAPDETNWRSVDPAKTLMWGVQRLSKAPGVRKWLMGVLATYNQAAMAKLRADALANREKQLKAAAALKAATDASRAYRTRQRRAATPPTPAAPPVEALEPMPDPAPAEPEASAGVPGWVLPVGVGVGTLVLLGIVGAVVRG